MGHNRVEDSKRQSKGSAREMAGKVSGNKTREAAGKLERNRGRVQKGVDRTADELRDEDKRRH
ncbi:MAG: CsbD family protein [Rhodanobacter sp.]|jgi:uncharacterized protein YjbJ (UPF0337 family)|nr:CsbD family protein [Rhodanobacter sp.]